MSDGDENRSGRRRLDPRYLYDPKWRHHPDYRGNKSPSKSPSKSSDNSDPSQFKEQYDATIAARAPPPSPPPDYTTSAYKSSATDKGKAASSKSKTTSSKGKTASSKDQPTNPHPTEPQSSQALTVTGPQERQVVKWSSTVRPGPYDAANMPQDGDRYIEEEKWRIAWGYADGLELKDLWKRVPNREASSGPGAHWRLHLANKPEFAWVQPLRDANSKKVIEDILINRRQEEAKQKAAKEKTDADNAEKKRKSDAGGKGGKRRNEDTRRDEKKKRRRIKWCEKWWSWWSKVGRIMTGWTKKQMHAQGNEDKITA